ncbi:hypothetical protein BDN72DRAFT_864371, partial [Pluteus cervinus]
RWWNWPPSADTIEYMTLGPEDEAIWQSPDGVWYHRPGPVRYNSQGLPEYLVGRILSWSRTRRLYLVQWDGWPPSFNSWQDVRPGTNGVLLVVPVSPYEAPDVDGPFESDADGSFESDADGPFETDLDGLSIGSEPDSSSEPDSEMDGVEVDGGEVQGS